MTDATLTRAERQPGARTAKLSWLRRAMSPLAVLCLALVFMAIALSLPIRLPIGPMYWDLFLYFDAANRIFDGQVPIVDFFMPVGPLGYYLFAGGTILFPGAQPLLLVSWSLLAVTAPLMALALRPVDRRSRATALTLLLPFLLFSILPFNGADYYPYPGSDGFGIYNRQVCQLLYVLATALLFVRGQVVLATLVALCMLALFFLKITGFVAGILICAYAFVAGRIALKSAIAAALGFFAVLGVVELATGMVSGYFTDILALLALNAGGLVGRMLQATSHNFGVILPGAALCLLLVVRDRRDLFSSLRSAVEARTFSRVQMRQFEALANHHAFWLGMLMLAGLVFESQNTGSQAMIFIWPVMLLILLDASRPDTGGRIFIAVTVLALAATLPIAVNMVERAGRAWVGALANNLPLEHSNLKTLGAVNMRPVVDDRARRLLAIYPEHRDAYQSLTDAGEMPSFLQFSDFDFQINWLRTTDAAIDAIHAYEARENVRFETILLMDFTNPFPWLMDRSGVKHITIGADPFRAVPPPTPDVEAAVAAVDLALYPTCPTTTQNDSLRKIYLPMLEDHAPVALTPCFTAYIRNGLAR